LAKIVDFANFKKYDGCVACPNYVSTNSDFSETTLNSDVSQHFGIFTQHCSKAKTFLFIASYENYSMDFISSAVICFKQSYGFYTFLWVKLATTLGEKNSKSNFISKKVNRPKSVHHQ